jgi:carboxyl-terminal processing protease
MLPAAVKGPGINFGLPDVCLTPAGPCPVPIPYPNFAFHFMATAFCPNILFTAMPALNMASTVTLSVGMQPGVAHPLYMEYSQFVVGCPKVLLAGQPAVTLTNSTTSNAMNNGVGTVIVAVNKVLFARAPAPAGEDRPALGRASPCGTVLRVPSFAFGVASEVRRVLAGSPAGLVIDLRGNPGGEVGACIDLLRDLLPEGAEIARLVDADGDATVYRARGDRYGGPLTVLVDRGTASAAELFAGSLQAHRRARIAGERTYGKAVVTAQGPDGEAGQVARFVLPGGREVQGIGVTPD